MYPRSAKQHTSNTHINSQGNARAINTVQGYETEMLPARSRCNYRCSNSLDPHPETNCYQLQIMKSFKTSETVYFLVHRVHFVCFTAIS